MAKVNYDAMRIKLEFLYRLLNYTQATMRVQYKMSEADILPTTNLVSTIGLNLIWVQRAVPGEPVTIDASKKAQYICQIIADEMLGLAARIRIECAGIPTDEILVRSEQILQDGIDKIVRMIQDISEGKGVHHG